MADVLSGSVTRSDRPVSRYSYSGIYELVIERGAWDAWLADETWGGWDRVVFAGDHREGAVEVMASTDTDTLSFSLAERDGAEFLDFVADLGDESDEDRTNYMTDMVKQVRSGRIGQVSAGLFLVDYRWQLEGDQDGIDVDRLICTAGAMREFSVVTFGAMGGDAPVRKLSLAAGTVGLADRSRLEAGPVRLMELKGGEAVPFDVEESRKAARLKAENSGDPAPPTMTARMADARIRARSRRVKT